MASSLKPPPKAALQRFHAGQVGDDTVETYLAKGWSVGICCKACERLVEWTPPELAARFEGREGLRIADLVPRLTCKGEDGCGSNEVTVFPHLYDGDWRWAP
ncbi:MAG: hypothetical protein A2790_20045 [Phenylobacterium sp. RIFCSPHIGHO2_01_FULL_69_31]|uniref:hypothetical protein n=1 Tax=Phenylobacterium sp. RIFCSPHIGHO2_01_FULL_69_31 TaxID=1801944 RepID=UPI0008D28E9E|nr:hypothetical protein [Phenylobacterium sp. RIFCSPHIGHO2_01_FULL_69_31]OHB26260.1 MAG: hypothetical protein A2790_20045 [Phenylobacterium sp. RIFCSPHIGHO2_01_FULL_69_31]